MLAAHQRHDSCVRMLLEYGANPDDSVRATGWTPLMFALRSGAVESCRMLLEAGASAGFKPRTSSLATPSNRSGQHRKLEAGQQRLHDRRLFPRDKQSGWTPVMIAAHNCLGSSHAACMKLCLRARRVIWILCYGVRQIRWRTLEKREVQKILPKTWEQRGVEVARSRTKEMVTHWRQRKKSRMPVEPVVNGV